MIASRFASLGLFAMALACSGADAAGFDDDFNDGVVGPQWTTVVDSPGTLTLSESSGRLNVTATSPPPNSDALYLSNGPGGFRLSTGASFEIRADYSFLAATGPGAFDASLVFGVGRDLDGTDSAAIGFARGAVQVGPVLLPVAGLVVAHRTDDVQTADVLPLTGANAGTLVLSYDAAGDDLTFGRLGDAPLFTLADTVRTVWAADDLLVSLGARAQGATVTLGDAWLDNFQIVSGTTVVPEPTSLAGEALFATLLARRRK